MTYKIPFMGGKIMFCKECGARLEDGAQFCPNCGKKVIDTMPMEKAGSSPPKKKTVVVIGGLFLVLIIAVGAFFAANNQTGTNTDDEVTVQETVHNEESSQETTQHEETAQEVKSILNAGTYVNELDSITIVQDVTGQYSYNLTGYDEWGNFLLLSGMIDNENDYYLGVISDDESGNFIGKKFSITPVDENIVISSDDEALSFLCVQYDYTSEVDALEDNTTEYGALNDIEVFESEDNTDVGLKRPLTDYDTGILSEMQEQIPYIPLTADIIGKDVHVFGTLDFSTLNKLPSGNFEGYVGMSGIDSDATIDLYVYLTVVDYLVYGVTKDGIIVFEKRLIAENPELPNNISFEVLPEEMQSVNPCICRGINDASRYYLTWELENAYYIMEVWDRGTEYRILNILMTTDLEYCDWFNYCEVVYE